MSSRYRACLPNSLTGRRRVTAIPPVCSLIPQTSSSDINKPFTSTPTTPQTTIHNVSVRYHHSFSDPTSIIYQHGPSDIPPTPLPLSKRSKPLHFTTSLRNHPRHKPRPIPNSYWATPSLVACEFPYCPYPTKMGGRTISTKDIGGGKQKIDDLLLAGVRTFIDLTEPRELFPYYPHLSSRCSQLGIDVRSVEYHNFPIRDRSLPASIQDVRQILEVLKDNEGRGRVSAVHCRGGIGRTGLVVGCWLVESGVAQDGDDALKRIAVQWREVEKCKRFPVSPETGPQFEFVRNFTRRALLGAR